MSTILEDTDPMPIGRYKGTEMRNVDPQHLLWIADQTWSNKYLSLRAYIEKHRNTLEKEVAGE